MKSVFFLILLLLSISASVPPLVQDQYDSLQILYESLGGDMWDYSEIDGNEWQFPPHSSSGTDTTSHCIRTSHLILFPYANNHARIDPCIDDWKGIVCSTLSNDDDVSVVQELQLGSFNLSGSLPDQVFKNFNTSLSVLNISNNMLTGTIPSSTILLTNLTRLILFLNGLSGSIPSELSELRSLWDIGLHENSLTGEIPSSLGMLQDLQILYLYENHLNSTIPFSIGNIKGLLHLGMSFNELSGSLPESFSNLVSLEETYLSHNQLTGHIPEYLGCLSNQTDLALRYNRFTGPIPSSLGNLSNLNVLYLNDNLLTGELPETIFGLKNLQILFVSENKLSGSLSPLLGNLTSLTSLNVSGNYLKGSLPSTVSGLVELTEFDVSDNLFSGTLPADAISALEKVDKLFFQVNKFKGPVIDISPLPALKYFDVGQNQFTGRINLGNSSSISVYGASKNCLSLDLGGACNSNTLQELYLNGLHQNEACQDPVTLFQYSEIVPSCLWRTRTLRKLYLAGNGLVGDLESFQLDNLMELNINSNRFRGSLPSSFKSKTQSYDVFDISRNIFAGEIDFHIEPNSSTRSTIFRADVNRLSGKLQKESFKNFHEVSILDGNIIDCKTIPDEDENHKTYQCGSSIFDLSLYLWLTTLSIAVALYLFICFSSNEIAKQIRVIFCEMTQTDIFVDADDLDGMSQNALSKAAQLVQTLKRLLYTGVGYGLVLVSITSFIYICFDFIPGAEPYRSYTHQYTYGVSGLFLRRQLPALFLSLCYIVFFFVLVKIYLRLFVQEWSLLRNYDIAVAWTKERKKAVLENKIEYWLNFFQQLSIVAVFILISFGVNLTYVYAKVMSGSTSLFFIQFAIYAFNTLYRTFGIEYVVSLVFKNSKGHSSKASVAFAFILIMVDMVNPHIATLFIDPLCFRDLVIQPDAITTHYAYSSCYSRQYVPETGQRSCVEYALSPTDIVFQPPFIYSNHCRDAIFKNFIPIVIMNCISAAFGEPLLYFFMTWDAKELTDSKAILGFNFSMSDTILYDVTFSLIYISEDFVLLLVYGLISPVCGLAIILSIVSRACVLRGSICRYTKMQFQGLVDFSSLKRDRTNVDKKCQDAQENIQHFIWPGFAVATIVYSCMAFEMAADVDYANATDLAAPIFLVCLISTCDFFIRYYYYQENLVLKTKLIEKYEEATGSRISVEMARMPNNDRFSIDTENRNANGSTKNPLQET